MKRRSSLPLQVTATVTAFLIGTTVHLAAAPLSYVPVEAQPLGANVLRLLDALELLGKPLPNPVAEQLRNAARERDAQVLQQVLDQHVLFLVEINPEARVKVARGPAAAALQQAGYTPVLVKVLNASTGTPRLRMISQQAGPVYAGVSRLSMERQQQPLLRQNENTNRDTDRFLALEMFRSPPLTDQLSGLEVEYALGLIYSSEAGKREATIGFDTGEGNQDLGFRGEVPVLFQIRPAVPVRLRILDEQGEPSIARLSFRDQQGHVYPPQAKRLAPDLFFQPHIYRQDGETVDLPPGTFEVRSSRGPEYRVVVQTIDVPSEPPAELSVQLERWIDPGQRGFFSGDHHIHAAGCAHYTSPTEGISPADMFRQVKGEGLNVGCVLTWGPCFDFQRQFFAPQAHELSERWHLLKYDLEISGFGSQALGHVCLLNLRDQTYPGSGGTSTQGWPSWTVPVLRWAKEQGGVTGYAHSASGIKIDPASSTGWVLSRLDQNRDGRLSKAETDARLLPEPFEQIDRNRDARLDRPELQQSIDRVADQLPNWAIPEMNGVGAMEISVSVVEGVCDFISAMDTTRIQEWNTWYHLLNCGFPLKVSGETDFPCMSGRRVGQGRVYVQLDSPQQLDFPAWCEGLAAGRSYVSDGYAHAVAFDVAGRAPGFGDVQLPSAGTVDVAAEVAFAEEIPRAVAYGNLAVHSGRRVAGDTVVLHGSRGEDVERQGMRTVELVVNGVPVATREVPADGKPHSLEFKVAVERSSWIALRQFPQLHTNPVNVVVDEQPIRASRRSALWCIETIERLWKNRNRRIAEDQRPAARASYDRAIAKYRSIAAEAVNDVGP